MQICTLTQTYSHVSIPRSHHSLFTGWMPFLSFNQQRQSTEGSTVVNLKFVGYHACEVIMLHGYKMHIVLLACRSLSISAHVTDLMRSPSVSLCVHVYVSVCQSVQKVYCDKMAEWIWMPFGMVSVVGRGMCVLDGVVFVEGEGSVLGVNLGRSIVTNGDVVA